MVSPEFAVRNAGEFLEYLKARRAEALCAPDVFLESSTTMALGTLRDAEAGVAAAESSLPERLFVGGLHNGTTEKELRDVLSANSITAKSVTFLLDNGRSRGFAFIEPSTKAEVLAALELDGTIVLRGRRLRINEAHPLEEEHIKRGGRERPIPELSTRVYLCNLPYSCDATDVRALLSENDLTPVDVFLLTDKATGKSRGAGFVEFSSLDDAARTIGALNGVDYRGRRLVVHPAAPRSKS